MVVAVFKISSKYVRITRSLATRRTLGIPKLLKCINKAQPEPCYKKTQLRSRSHAYENRDLRSRSHFIFTRAPQPWAKAYLHETRYLQWTMSIHLELDNYHPDNCHPGKLPLMMYWILYVYWHYSHLNFTRCYFNDKNFVITNVKCVYNKSSLVLWPLGKNLYFTFNNFGWRMSDRCHHIFTKTFLSQCTP